MGMASWFTSGMEAIGLGSGAGEVVADPRAASGSEWDWVSHGLKSAMPQILGVTGKKAGSPRGGTATSSAKPVSGNASSAMSVATGIGKAANNDPLSNLNKWSNTF